ncbi:MAG: LysE family transporter [Patescibacteria group bacterium]|nr:LysE family transporter [Patescibacteria group bacterium]MDD4610651.1 LysE family transporter [Patescibacteria group bacterium]
MIGGRNRDNIKIFLDGLITGLILQTAIGPVFFFIVNLALQKSMTDGLAAVLAVTIVDYFYIVLAILGVGKLLENKKLKKVFGLISSLALIVFGILIFQSITKGNAAYLIINISSILSSFIAAFILTISNPMTIIFNTSFFTAKAVEYNYAKKELWVFGLAVGLATFIFMGGAVMIFSIFKQVIPLLAIQILNIIVGCLLVGYGSIRLFKIAKN